MQIQLDLNSLLLRFWSLVLEEFKTNPSRFVTSSYDQRNFGKILKNYHKTNMDLEHGFDKVPISRNHRKTAKEEVPRE